MEIQKLLNTLKNHLFKDLDSESTPSLEENEEYKGDSEDESEEDDFLLSDKIKWKERLSVEWYHLVKLD